MLKVIQYEQASEFLEKCGDLLMQHEAENNLIIGLANRLKHNPSAYSSTPFFSTVEEENKIILAALMTPPHNILLSNFTNDAIDALQELSDFLWQSGIIVNGVNSGKNIAKQFSSLWADRATLTSKIKMEEMIYRLDRVVAPKIPEGIFRKANIADFPLLSNWLPAFHKEALNEPLPSEEINHLKERIQSQSVYVWVTKEIVSVAMKTRETPNGATIGFVYTPTELRGKGYAKAVVASLSQHLLDNGFKFCTLYTNLANKTSNFIYQKIGFVPIIEAVDIRFSKEIN